MKTIIKMIIAGFVILLSGCSDNLDTKPLSFTTIDNFYQTADDAEIALKGCYGSVLKSYSVDAHSGIFFIGDLGTDEILGNPYFTPDPTSNMEQFIYGRITKGNLGIRDYWSTMYNSIYAINLLLDKIDGINMDENRKQQIKTEATFLRGWNYMYMGMVFGGVPLYTAVPHDPKKGRNTLQEVMNQAITDLQFAYDHMPNAALSNPGSASKWSAGGYLARLYCYLASCKKYGAGQSLNFPLNSFDWVDVDQFYQKASEIATIIINQSGLKLTNDYKTLFCEGSINKQKEEVLFTFLSSRQAQVGFGMNFYHPVGFYGGGYGTIRPTQEVYSRYDTLYDARANWVVGGLAIEPITETIDGQIYYKPNKLTLSNGVTIDGDYCINKYRKLTSSAASMTVYYGYYPLMRLAEIYLLKAEAIAHTQGDEAGREILKVVRQRALISSRSTDPNSLQIPYRRSDFIEELLDERSRELCFEQQRRFDLVRFNRYESTVKSISTTRGIWNINSAAQLVENVTDRKIWFPIPEEDEIINRNLIPNNPGY